MHVKMTNDMSFNNKVSASHSSKSKPDCLKQIFQQDIQTTYLGQCCARHCMRCDCPGHNRTKALVTLTLPEIVEAMRHDLSQPCSLETIAAAFCMSPEQIARFSNGGSEVDQVLGPCNCSWLEHGFSDFDPSKPRGDTQERGEASACNKGYKEHNMNLA